MLAVTLHDSLDSIPRLESGGDYLWLNEIHVSERHRGLGGGRRMMEFLADWARSNRIRAIYGICALSNPGAQSFYRRLGFATEQACWLSRSLGT
jgi:GNAT superfamily N-acetyltransferase